MNEQYHRLWILAKERIARKAADSMFRPEKQAYMYELLAELDILEAEAILED